jgi:4-hydroxy-tetrahydrodipicolinate reductase
MGAEVCRAVASTADLHLVASLGRRDTLQALLDARAEAVVDFTHPAEVMNSLDFCVRHGIHAVVGTTGFDAQRLAQLREWLETAPGVGILIAPNFSIGALLAMRFAAAAAAFYDSVEVLDVHHAGKVDAPSGTAQRSAELIARAREAAKLPPIPDATSLAADGARGADVQGIRVHSLRLRGVVGRTEIILGGAGETLSLRHDSLDRASFMPGVLAGLRGIATRQGLTYGLEHFLDLS